MPLLLLSTSAIMSYSSASVAVKLMCVRGHKFSSMHKPGAIIKILTTRKKAARNVERAVAAQDEGFEHKASRSIAKNSLTHNEKFTDITSGDIKETISHQPYLGNSMHHDLLLFACIFHTSVFLVPSSPCSL